jgi:hypothetical protein
MKSGQQQIDQSRQSSGSDQQSDQKSTEQMRGSASEESKKPERLSGRKLPLPD